MSQDLLIIGAGNVGGFLAYNLDLFDREYRIRGFLDDDPAKVGQEVFGYPVLGPVKSLADHAPGTAVALSINTPAIKKKIIEALPQDRYEFPAFVSRNAWLSHSVTVGRGSIIYPGVSINHESQIGDFVTMNMNCAIGHNCTVGHFSSLAPGVNFAGFTLIGEAVEVGIGVCTIQQVKVGAGSILGGQTMVIRDLPPGSKAVGVPARTIGK